MSSVWKLLVVLALALQLGAQTPGSAQPTVEMAAVTGAHVRPGSTTKVELDFRVGSNFHINSNKPNSPLLIPTSLTLTAPAGLQIAALHYPPGEDQSFPFAPNEKLSVYTGDFAIDASVKALPSVAPGSYNVTGELRYQACDKSACYPPKKMPVQFKVTVP
jgi:hypothetical protein